MIYPYPCIQKFVQHVELKDYRSETKQAYLGVVCRLAKHFQSDPATVCQDQLREYFVFLRQEKHLQPNTVKHVKAALTCFFLECLKVDGWTVFQDIRISRPTVLPVVLSRGEVQRVLQAVREPRFATCLNLIYHCGLRISEALVLEVFDIQGREHPPRLFIRDGKGGKDRYVPIAPAMVQALRRWWLTHRHPRLLFPTPAHPMSAATHPMSPESVREAFRWARAATGINPAATPHTLRHSYATHMLEEGVALPHLAQYLGHKSLDTTIIYTHLTDVSQARTQTALGKLYVPLKS
jgi:integrase/recombinase XerD